MLQEKSKPGYLAPEVVLRRLSVIQCRLTKQPAPLSNASKLGCVALGELDPTTAADMIPDVGQE